MVLSIRVLNEIVIFSSKIKSMYVYLKSIERLESLFNGKNIFYITLLNFIVREDSKTN